MYRRTRISEIKKHIQDLDSFGIAYTNSKPTLLSELVNFLNRINVRHKVDKNSNIIIER